MAKEKAGRKKKSKKKHAKPPKSAPKQTLKAEGASDEVELTLTWTGGTASLASLTDNGDPVDFSREQGLDPAKLMLRWYSPRATLHVVQWDLWFDGTRTKLKANAIVNNGAAKFPKPVESKKETDRWSASGAAS